MSSRFFPKNVHAVERGLRVLLGAALLLLAFVGPKTPWGFLGFILILTGAIGSCPIFSVLGISTCRVNPKPKPI